MRASFEKGLSAYPYREKEGKLFKVPTQEFVFEKVLPVKVAEAVAFRMNILNNKGHGLSAVTINILISQEGRRLFESKDITGVQYTEAVKAAG